MLKAERYDRSINLIEKQWFKTTENTNNSFKDLSVGEKHYWVDYTFTMILIAREQ